MTAALVGVACESTVPGRAVDTTESHNAGGVNLALLDHGMYPTTAVPLSFSANGNAVVALEGQRMADAVVLPSEVDSALRQPRVFNTGAVENAQALQADIGLTRANILAAQGFLAGFSTARDSKGRAVTDSSMVNLVMRFTDQDAASAAVAALAATTGNQKPTSIPRHPDTAASSFDMAHGVIVESFTPQRNYLLYQWTQTSRPIQVAAELVAKTLDLQVPRIERFAPTGPSHLGGSSADPTGLLAHTLPIPPGIVSPNTGVYSGRAALHFQADPVDSATAFTAAGVEAVSFRGATVFKSRDAASAAALADQLSARDVAAGATDPGSSRLAQGKLRRRGCGRAPGATTVPLLCERRCVRLRDFVQGAGGRTQTGGGPIPHLARLPPLTTARHSERGRPRYHYRP